MGSKQSVIVRSAPALAFCCSSSGNDDNGLRFQSRADLVRANLALQLQEVQQETYIDDINEMIDESFDSSDGGGSGVEE